VEKLQRRREEQVAEDRPRLLVGDGGRADGCRLEEIQETIRKNRDRNDWSSWVVTIY